MDLKNKVILVTGGEGFVGQKLVQYLKTIPAKVLVFDQKDGQDITRWSNLENFTSEPVDVVYHLAGKVFVPESWEKPRQFYEVNVLGTLNVLEFCRMRKVKKMIFTSSYLYGCPRYLPIDENHPVLSLNPYHKSKILAEDLCRAYHEQFRLPCVILRVFNIYGEGQPGQFLIPKIINQINNAGKIVLDDPRPKRDMLYIDDLIQALVKSAEYEKSPFDIFNIGSGQNYQVKELVEAIVKIFNKQVRIDYLNKKRKDEIPETLADITKAKALLGWTPANDLEEGLIKTIKSYEMRRKNDQGDK